MSGDRQLEHSTVVVDEDSTRPNQDLENGGVPDKSAGGEVAVETSSGDSHQDNDNGSECQICHMSTATAVVINLGCRCNLYLSRAHAVCAEKWFRLKSNRQCKICGEIAKTVQISKAKDTSIRDIAWYSWIANKSDEQNGLAPPVANNGHLPTNGTCEVLNCLCRTGEYIVMLVLILGILGILGSVGYFLVKAMIGIWMNRVEFKSP